MISNVLICLRCEEPLSENTGHVCRRMVRNPAVAMTADLMVRDGLFYHLSVLVGTATAKRLIREAWVRL